MPSVFDPSGCNINNNTNSYSRASTNDCNNDHANGSTPAGISTRDSLSRLRRTSESCPLSSSRLGTLIIIIIVIVIVVMVLIRVILIILDSHLYQY